MIFRSNNHFNQGTAYCKEFQTYWVLWDFIIFHWYFWFITMFMDFTFPRINISTNLLYNKLMIRFYTVKLKPWRYPQNHLQKNQQNFDNPWTLIVTTAFVNNYVIWMVILYYNSVSLKDNEIIFSYNVNDKFTWNLPR